MNLKRMFNIKSKDRLSFLTQVSTGTIVLVILAAIIIFPFTSAQINKDNDFFIKSQKDNIDHFSYVYSSQLKNIYEDILFLEDVLGDDYDINQLSSLFRKFTIRNSLYDEIYFVDSNNVSSFTVLRVNDSVRIQTDGIKAVDSHFIEVLDSIDDRQVLYSEIFYESTAHHEHVEHYQYIGKRVNTEFNTGYIVVKINHVDMMNSISDITQGSTGNLYHISQDNHILFNELLVNSDFAHEITEIYPDMKNFEMQANTLIALTDNNTFFIKDKVNVRFDNTIRDNIILVNPTTYIVLVFSESRNHLFVSLSDTGEIFRQSLHALMISFIIAFSSSYVIVHAKFRRDYEYKRLKTLAEFDDQTGAYTRSAGTEILNTLINENKIIKNFTICFIDVDGLKEINDTFGHIYGDNMISDVVKIIKGITRKSDFIIRYGGDEFLIILPSEDEDSALATWDKIDKKFKHINSDVGLPYNYSVSAGIVENEKFKRQYLKKIEASSITHVSDYITDLINEADARMYVSKNKNKQNHDYKIIK